jgi:chromosome segregation ATPase
MLQQYKALRLKRFEAKVKAERIASLETMVQDVAAMADALSEQIAAEEQRTKVVDAKRPDYSMLALNASARRAKLMASLVELRASLDAAKREQVTAEAEVKDLEFALETSAVGVVALNAARPNLKWGRGTG